MNQASNSPLSPQWPRRLSIMGSTGSIGRQTLEVVAAYPDLFKVEALTACRNWQLLAEQALKFSPRCVVIADSQFLEPLRQALSGTDIEVLAGTEALDHAATLPESDMVVGALVGYSGLESTIAALEAGKQLALANKETLVVAGEIISEIARRKGIRILPVDSEHSAIFQCLLGENPDSVSKIILTASGGPFRTVPRDRLAEVTVSQALAHPNWDMGAKVTIDSATMMNKGFEMMEAMWLFSKRPADIEVAVHPESIVHSMVEFVDGSVKAQLGLPDMRLPIEVAIAYPCRLDLMRGLSTPRLNLTEAGRLTFEKPDLEKFPLLRLAYEVAEAGGLNPALLNAGNEVAVKAFLQQRIGFTDIYEVVSRTVTDGNAAVASLPVSLMSIEESHSLGTDIADKIIAEERHKSFSFK